MTSWKNIPARGHHLEGSRHIYRAEYPAGIREPALPMTNRTPVTVLSVFENWCGAQGLTLIRVQCDLTGSRAHVLPADLGLHTSTL